MAYSVNVKEAARRHYRAAQVLYDQSGAGDQPRCKTVAGYLFGVAGELALKALMLSSGIRPLQTDKRRDDPFYAHFPALKKLLATATGRRAIELRRISASPNLFQDWDIAMRYAPAKDINLTWVDAWKESAKDLIGRMDQV